ncbi:retropepsin-like aspartic protease family protein [Halopseudomonas pelagia]|uniref:retropepsin-like aspartic protease family protein n=1 Tax=Halopseudomonas pelagia TaxID=553151 RepID=UPI0003A5A1E9|nr:TIGR02281 family clan AA aspartic protease [Halopseudomonas pelagia]|tara:strand:+ start:30015 stop:30659 length:645 start_codon:yes stop_codon:yes gene_type:complete
MLKLHIVTMSLLALFSSTALAEPVVRVVGLFSGAAVVNIDGQRHMLRIGQPGAQGVELLAADSRTATLRINGQTREFGMQRDYTEGFAQRQTRQVSIPRGTGGHYRVTGSINGHSVPFMVDTGATSVALNSFQAQRLGIDYRTTGVEVRATTASGQVQGYRVKLGRVKVGELELTNVDGLVLEGGFPTEVLLGNSYLNRVRMVDQGGILVLESR